MLVGCRIERSSLSRAAGQGFKQAVHLDTDRGNLKLSQRGEPRACNHRVCKAVNCVAAAKPVSRPPAWIKAKNG